jgi:colanic acid/amylovoran biosynthesis protein
MKVLITNSVPLNGGDEALLRATILGIKKIDPESIINVLCNNPDIARNQIKYVNIDWDWEYTTNMVDNYLIYKLFNILRRFINKFGVKNYSFFSTLFVSKNEKNIIRLYKEADYVVSSAGGYIHDIYSYNKRLDAFMLALRFNKKLIFFGHSMGPFFSENIKEHSRLKEILAKSHKIFLRESISKKHLESIGYFGENITVSTDIAFFIYNEIKEKYKKNKKQNNELVVSFREWSYNFNIDDFQTKAVEIISHLIKRGYKITFLSTCQGISNYKNDSMFAEKIKDNLTPEISKNFYIDKKKYSLEELINKYSQFDGYIGMRLHGAILSMISGTPAFCIGYEDKSVGIYDFLGISGYHSKYDDKTQKILEKIDVFLENLEKIDLSEILERASKCAEKNFEVFE